MELYLVVSLYVRYYAFTILYAKCTKQYKLIYLKQYIRHYIGIFSINNWKLCPMYFPCVLYIIIALLRMWEKNITIEYININESRYTSIDCTFKKREGKHINSFESTVFWSEPNIIRTNKVCTSRFVNLGIIS